jgi:hypothetical protein
MEGGGHESLQVLGAGAVLLSKSYAVLCSCAISNSVGLNLLLWCFLMLIITRYVVTLWGGCRSFVLSDKEEVWESQVGPGLKPVDSSSTQVQIPPPPLTLWVTLETFLQLFLFFSWHTIFVHIQGDAIIWYMYTSYSDQIRVTSISISSNIGHLCMLGHTDYKP